MSGWTFSYALNGWPNPPEGFSIELEDIDTDGTVGSNWMITEAPPYGNDGNRRSPGFAFGINATPTPTITDTPHAYLNHTNPHPYANIHSQSTSPAPSITPTACSADLDGNGLVDEKDLVLLLEALLPKP